MTSKRDLLVLARKGAEDPKQLEQEVKELNALLLLTETVKNLCSCSEVIDVNRYKIVQKPSKLEKILSSPQLRPFQFLYNKN